MISDNSRFYFFIYARFISNTFKEALLPFAPWELLFWKRSTNISIRLSSKNSFKDWRDAISYISKGENMLEGSCPGLIFTVSINYWLWLSVFLAAVLFYLSFSLPSFYLLTASSSS